MTTQALNPMKRRYCCLIALLLITATELIAAVGHPFFVNFSPATYGAHNRNFDILSDRQGRVYVANFEGLLCYDQSEWHVVHAPGIFRITRLYQDKKGRIWVGGFNVFGYLMHNERGELTLKTVFSKDSKGFIGEVTDIREEQGKICIETSIGTAGLEDHSMDSYRIVKTPATPKRMYRGVAVNDSHQLPDGSTVLATAGSGLIVTDAEGNERYHLTEKGGLCDDNVNAVFADAYGNVWGATDNGVFLTDVFTAYTHFDTSNGLSGEVLSICHTPQGLYVGTLKGLFRKQDQRFERIGSITNACWNLTRDTNGELIASTAEGIFIINGNHSRQLTQKHTVQTYPIGNGSYYAGEVDGVYLIRKTANGTIDERQVNTIEKATTFVVPQDGSLWVRNIYGQVFRCTGDYKKLNEMLPQGKEKEERYHYNLMERDGRIMMVGRNGTYVWDTSRQAIVKDEGKELWGQDRRYAQLMVNDGERLWMTDNEGKNLQLFTEKGTKTANERLRPIHNLNIRALDINPPYVWMGGNFGLLCWNSAYQDPDTRQQGKVFFRRITTDNDSVIWGGFSGLDQLTTQLPFTKLTFESDVQHVVIHFATNMPSTLGETLFRYRLKESQNWSAWSPETKVTLSNPRAGNYHLEVMACDRYGRLLPKAELLLQVRYPVYLRWYFVTLYIILLAICVVAFVRWRMSRLLQEKLRLESIVEERTSQIRQQKDEIEEKSNSLEKALKDLNAAQYQLLRQERMATVGTLTKGLVDRILNPMNYVNNFSHMSLGLLKDMKENLEDEEEKMTPDTYDDCLDLVDMLETNVSKIEEHGINTTRILKAMEEMLKERPCTRNETDIAALCRKDIEMTHAYYAQQIEECHIRIETTGTNDPLLAKVDAEQLSKVIMSMIGNSIYAVCKKYRQKAYEPIVRLSAETDREEGLLRISIYDNGIGIEQTIIDKIFDPFFTTKTTAEAVGVGMYLSREIVLNHGGDIRVESKKEQETMFTISIPIQ